MNDFIYSNKPDHNAISANLENEYFSLKGFADFIDTNNNNRIKEEDSDKVFAKKLVRDDGSYRLYIRLDNNGKLYNPMSIYGETKQSSFLDRVCRSQNKFKEVNQKAFSLYLSFLKNKNLAWFHNAEREV